MSRGRPQNRTLRHGELPNALPRLRQRQRLHRQDGKHTRHEVENDAAQNARATAPRNVRSSELVACAEGGRLFFAATENAPAPKSSERLQSARRVGRARDVAPSMSACSNRL